MSEIVGQDERILLSQWVKQIQEAKENVDAALNHIMIAYIEALSEIGEPSIIRTRSKEFSVRVIKAIKVLNEFQGTIIKESIFNETKEGNIQ